MTDKKSCPSLIVRNFSINLNSALRYVNTAACASDCFDSTVIVGETLSHHNYPPFINTALQAVGKLTECDTSNNLAVCTIPPLSTEQNDNNNSNNNNESSCGEAKATQRLVIWSPTGPLDRDYDDARRYREATSTGQGVIQTFSVN